MRKFLPSKRPPPIEKASAFNGGGCGTVMVICFSKLSNGLRSSTADFSNSTRSSSDEFNGDEPPDEFAKLPFSSFTRNISSTKPYSSVSMPFESFWIFSWLNFKLPCPMLKVSLNAISGSHWICRDIKRKILVLQFEKFRQFSEIRLLFSV